jgi:hypothetical protein
MNCDAARDCIVLLAYGELSDEQAMSLEMHLRVCAGCMEEWSAVRGLDAMMAFHPVAEVDPNLLAQSRMRLDEALDAQPQHAFLTRFRANAFSWLGHLQSAPALATLLLGIGFLGGNFTYRYQVSHAPRVVPPVILTNTTGGGISTVASVTPLPNGLVQVNYNRVVPEMAQGSLNDPQIRALLMVGTRAPADNLVRMDAVALLAEECRTDFECKGQSDSSGVRGALLVSLRSDRSPRVRLNALEGLQPFVSQDQRVRDAVARALLTDASAAVRTRAVAILQPVQGDSSVRQVLRTVSTTDENPYLRTVSTQALEGSSSIQ